MLKRFKNKKVDGDWLHTNFPCMMACPAHTNAGRYVGLIAGRVDGLGGNANAIPPSLGGYRPTPLPCKEPRAERREEFTGKVISVIYDRFGDFAGFVLETEDGNRRFIAREPEIERVINRAWAERILTSVIVELDAPHRPEEIVLHCPPKPLTH